MTQIALIRSAQGGDVEAFEALLAGCYDSLFRFAYKWCGNRADAEDIAQLACVKLAKNLEQFRFESAFSSWLYRLVINCAKDWQRSQSKHEQCIDERDVLQGQPALEDEACASILLRQVLDQVNTLGEGMKETVLLVFAEGLSHAEAAAVLGVKENTVSWRIHQVRKKLKLMHGQEGSAL